MKETLVTSYNPAWPEWFARLKERIDPVLRDVPHTVDALHEWLFPVDPNRIDADGKLVGVPDAESEARRVEQMLIERLSPKALVWVGVQQIAGVSLVLVEAPAGKDLPYAFEDVVYLRIGSETRKAGAAAIREMVVRKSAEPERWERRLSTCATGSDVETGEVQAAVAEEPILVPSRPCGKGGLARNFC
jgi:hypothetical protein